MAAFLPDSDSDEHVSGQPQLSAVVAAIDLGTTSSGVAFSFRKAYQKNHMDIQMATSSNARNTQTVKEPTAVLFDPKKRFHSFGQKAEDFFSDLCQRDLEEARKWCYFSRFKMKLFDEETKTVRPELQDHWGTHTMPAIRVFSAAIEHLTNNVLGRISKFDLYDSDVDWMITIPAIWNNKAEQFMTEAAVEAGIPTKQLGIVLEPEAAVTYCRVESEEESLRGERLLFDIAQGLAGKSFMVLDCGGVASTTVVYEASKEEKGTLLRLHGPTGVDWGGARVDDAFHRFLDDLLGPENVAAISTSQMLGLRKELEQGKRDFRPGLRVSIALPSAVKVLLQAADLKQFPEVKVQDDHLSIDPENFGSFLTPTVNAILDHVKDVLRLEETKDVKTIVMVGGFSQCQLLRDAVSKAFSDVTVVLPDKAEASVLMGAVLYRHEPNVIGWKVSVFTYGVRVKQPFVEGVHDPSKKWINEDGKARCSDIFCKMISSGDVLFLGKKSEIITISPSLKNEATSTLTIFCTKNPNVTYTTEPGCRQIGEIILPYRMLLPDQRKLITEAWLEVGSTSLKAKVRDTLTGEVYTTECSPFTE